MPASACKKWDISLKNRISQTYYLTTHLNGDTFCSCLSTFGKITQRRIHVIRLFLDQHLDHVGRNDEHSKMFDNFQDYDTFWWIWQLHWDIWFSYSYKANQRYLLIMFACRAVLTVIFFFSVCRAWLFFSLIQNLFHRSLSKLLCI